MTAKQRSLYFMHLWPAACERQGWNVKDADRRREVTMEATGSESTTGLDEDEISVLFRELEWLANPADFDLAMAAADHDHEKELNRRRNLVWLIEQVGIEPHYLDTMSEKKCRRHHCHVWRELPPHDLRSLLCTARRRAREARKAGRNIFANLCELGQMAQVSSQAADCPF